MFQQILQKDLGEEPKKGKSYFYVRVNEKTTLEEFVFKNTLLMLSFKITLPDDKTNNISR